MPRAPGSRAAELRVGSRHEDGTRDDTDVPAGRDGAFSNGEPELSATPGKYRTQAQAGAPTTASMLPGKRLLGACLVGTDRGPNET